MEELIRRSEAGRAYRKLLEEIKKTGVLVEMDTDLQARIVGIRMNEPDPAEQFKRYQYMRHAIANFEPFIQAVIDDGASAELEIKTGKAPKKTKVIQ